MAIRQLEDMLGAPLFLVPVEDIEPSRVVVAWRAGAENAAARSFVALAARYARS